MLLSRSIRVRGVSPLATSFVCRLKSSGKPLEVPYYGMTATVATSSHEMQGHRPYMEDRLVTDFDNKLAAVFDGHGGAGVAETLHKNYLSVLKSKYINDESLPSFTNKEVVEGLTEALKDVDNMVLPNRSLHMVGSTFALSFVHNNPQASIITVNVGDSRVVLSQGGKAIDLTVDHKPSTKGEKSRIEKLGGKVVFSGGCPRVGGVLALSRAVGDRYLKPYVSTDPDVRIHTMTPKDEFVIVATDGIWEDFSSQEAVDYVYHMKKSIELTMKDDKKRKDILDMFPNVKDVEWIKRKLVAELLCHAAIKKGSTDNVSVIIQWLDLKSE